MDLKNNTLYPLLVLFFVIGLVVGYVIHQPGTEVKYVTNTVEVPKIVEKIVEMNATPTPAAAEATPVPTAVPDFEAKIYDPAKETPTYEIQIIDWDAKPNKISLRPGETVLFKVVRYPGDLQPPEFVMGSYHNPNIGTAGQIIIKFNKAGTYNFEVNVPPADKNQGILPTPYAKGSVMVY